MVLAYPHPNLTDHYVTLRPWAERDLACVAEASLEPRILEVTTVPSSYTPEDGLAFIVRQRSRLTRRKGIALAIAESQSDEAVGHINLLYRSVSGVAGIGYWLLERKRGDGLASRAVHLLTRWAFRTAELARIEALVEPDNVASARVLERAGFQREGLLRSYLAFETRRADALIYSLLPSDIEAELF